MRCKTRHGQLQAGDMDVSSQSVSLASWLQSGTMMTGESWKQLLMLWQQGSRERSGESAGHALSADFPDQDPHSDTAHSATASPVDESADGYCAPMTQSPSKDT